MPSGRVISSCAWGPSPSCSGDWRLGAVFLMPLTFPAIQNASSSAPRWSRSARRSISSPSTFPSNPFQSLANSIVPAVVLFSAFLGVALMGIEKKEPLLGSLQVLERMLARANRFAVRLTPLGLFAIAAVTVGTTDTEQMGRLRVFLIGYAAMSLLLALWILPGLVACLTPIPARRILQSTRDALITAFITGELFIVLPALIDRSKELLEEHGCPEPEEGAPADVIVPAFYSFPHVAKLLSLSFVLFAAWYSDTELTLAGARAARPGRDREPVRKPERGHPVPAGPRARPRRHLPVVPRHRRPQLALRHAGGGDAHGRARPGRDLRPDGPAPLLRPRASFATSWSRPRRPRPRWRLTAFLVRATGVGTYDKDQVALSMQFLHPPSQKAVVLRELPTEPPTPAAARACPCCRPCWSAGVLRVGYIDGSMPYSFLNGRGELVGFDVEMAHALAAELGVALEFAPVPRDRLAEALDAGRCDVIMGGVFVTTRRGARMVYSSNYIDETLAFIVPDYRRADFSSAEWIRGDAGSQGGGSRTCPTSWASCSVSSRASPSFPSPSPTRASPISSRDAGPSVDALAYTAERGSFRSLLLSRLLGGRPAPGRPQAAARLPGGPTRRRSRAVPLELDRPQDRRTGRSRPSTTTGCSGAMRGPQRPRWSVLRNVLHWVN